MNVWKMVAGKMFLPLVLGIVIVILSMWVGAYEKKMERVLVDVEMEEWVASEGVVAGEGVVFELNEGD